MTSKRKVLHLVTWMNQGGIETWLLRYLGIANSSDSWHADILCRGKDEGRLADAARQLGAKVDHLPFANNSDASVAKLANYLKVNRYDIVHGHLNALNSVVVKAAKMARVPVLAMYHNERLYPQRSGLLHSLSLPLVKFYTDRLVRYSTRNADFIAPVSHAVLHELERINRGTMSNSAVIYLGTPEASVQTKEQRRHIREAVFKVGEKEKIVLHVGSFTNQKNHFGIVDAFVKVHARHPEARLVLVGSGNLVPKVQSRADNSSAKDAIQFLGLRSDVEQLMLASDVFFLPSFHEGLPIVVMEAFAAGLPVVGSRIPSLVEAMGGITFSLAPATDHDSLASILSRVLSDATFADQLRAIGHERNRCDFSLSASTERLHKAYLQLLNDPSTLASTSETQPSPARRSNQDV